jgi:hypothetical protein
VRIAAITDVHAVACAFAEALKAARLEGFDHLLIMGDLLTYGVAPQETLALAHEAVDRDGAVLLMGNHDQLYLDLAQGRTAYRDGLAEWLQETIDWTAARVEAETLRRLPWQEQWLAGPIFAAHANPFQFGDWTYLNDEPSFQRASMALADRGARHGLFGHTHRARLYSGGPSEVHTLPSLGQPRDREKPEPRWTMVEISGNELTLSSRTVPFDRAAHCRAVDATSMSSPTKSRLCSWFL